jgi:hypothetical protein
MSRESFSDMIRAVDEFEKRNGVFGPVVLQESKARDLTEQLPTDPGKGSPDPVARLFSRMGLERESYPKATAGEVKLIDEAPTKARLVTEPKPTKPTMAVEEARTRLLESMNGGGDSSKITDEMYTKLCR